MSRGQENQVFKQAKSNSQQDQNNAETSFNDAQSGIGAFNDRLNTYYGQDPYKAGGEFDQAEKTIATGAADANANALQGELQMAGKRSGENTSSFAPTLQAAQRQGVLDVANQEAKSTADRLQDETRYQQYGLESSKFPVQAETQLNAMETGGANNSLGTEQQAAKSPGFWDWFLQQASQNAQTAAKFAGAGAGGGAA